MRKKIPLEPREPTGALRVPPFGSSLHVSHRVSTSVVRAGVRGRRRACVCVCACVCACVRACALLWGAGQRSGSWGEVKDLSGPKRVLAGAVSWALLRLPCLAGRSLQGQEEQAPAPQDAATGWRLWRGRGGTCWEKPGQQVRERANEPRRRWPGPLAPRAVDPCSCDSRDASQHSACRCTRLVSRRECSGPAATAGCQPGRASLSAVPAAPSSSSSFPAPASPPGSN